MIVPEDLRQTIARWAGADGAAWLDALPVMVRDIAEDWSLTLGEPYPSGYTALALRAERDGEPLVLKVSFPEDGLEAAALRHYGGVASVALVDHDPKRHAMLLERCEPGTPLSAEPDDVATEVAAGLLAEMWSPPPANHPFGTMDESAARWTRRLERARGVVEEHIRAEALDVLPWLVAEAPEPVVLHCDLHPANALRATRRPWLVIDPKGWTGDPAFDLASLIRENATAENLPRRLAIVTDVLGLEPVRVRAWTLAVCAESVAWSHEVGDRVAVEKFTSAAALVSQLNVRS